MTTREALYKLGDEDRGGNPVAKRIPITKMNSGLILILSALYWKNAWRPSHNDKPIHGALAVAYTQPWYQAQVQSTTWLSWGPNCCHLPGNNTPSIDNSNDYISQEFIGLYCFRQEKQSIYRSWSWGLQAGNSGVLSVYLTIQKHLFIYHQLSI